MTISEMHVWFRQYAQQMGMQNVRAILPEQIDNLINTSIKDTIDEVINKSVGTTNDKIITDNSKLASINALRTLYKVKTIFWHEDKNIADYGNTPCTINSKDINNDILYYVDFSIRYTEPLPDPADFNIENIQYITLQLPYESVYKNNLIYYSYLLNMIRQGKGNDENPYKDNHPLSMFGTVQEAFNALIPRLDMQIRGMKTTKWFPIRIIDDSYLADVLNDWVLSPRLRSPVMVIYATDYDISPSSTGATSFEIYLGENDSDSLKNIISNKYIAQLRCSYIKKPAEVQYLSDVGGDNINCDLPEQLQIPMLKHAVDLYRISVQGSLYANQQNAQQANNENVRNNARPENEGYQS